MSESSCPSHPTVGDRTDNTQGQADETLAVPATSRLPATAASSGHPTPEETEAVLKLIDHFDRALIALIHETRSDPTR